MPAKPRPEVLYLLQLNAHRFNFMNMKSRVQDKWITHNFKLSTMVHPCRIGSQCETPTEFKNI